MTRPQGPRPFSPLRRRGRKRAAEGGRNGHPLRRAQLQKGIIVLPSAFTLANLFFGVFALVAASRGDYGWAAWFVVFAGVLDGLDGRVARVTRTGTSFGAQLDSLVDAISFGVAPAYIAYRLHFAGAEWAWLLALAFIMAVVIRLARFNVERGSGSNKEFTGLPSPAAGITVAAVYPFSQTEVAVRYLETLPWPEAVGGLMLMLAVLMVSPVPYSVLPTLGRYTPPRAVLIPGLVAGMAILLAWPEYVIFLSLMGYAFWGLAKAVTTGLLDRLPQSGALMDEDPMSESDDSVRDIRAPFAPRGNPQEKRP